MDSNESFMIPKIEECKAEREQKCNNLKIEMKLDRKRTTKIKKSGTIEMRKANNKQNKMINENYIILRSFKFIYFFLFRYNAL